MTEFRTANRFSCSFPPWFYLIIHLKKPFIVIFRQRLISRYLLKNLHVYYGCLLLYREDHTSLRRAEGFNLITSSFELFIAQVYDEVYTR